MYIAQLKKDLIEVKDYPNYFVDLDLLSVWSKISNKYLKSAIDGAGYEFVTLTNNKISKHFLLHRLFFQSVHGFLPEIVDHIDQNKLNNHPDNLRAATKSENCMNRSKGKNNTSGYKNVCKHQNGWKTKIRNKNVIDERYFKEKFQAVAYTQIMRKLLHGNFASD